MLNEHFIGSEIGIGVFLRWVQNEVVIIPLGIWLDDKFGVEDTV